VQFSKQKATWRAANLALLLQGLDGAHKLRHAVQNACQRKETAAESSHLLLHLVAERGGSNLHEAVDAGGDGRLVGQVPADAALVARLRG
jgi:hypothetical protein